LSSNIPYVGRGLFIVVEGADLSGKSTLAKAAADAAAKAGQTVILTCEPTKDTPDGKCIREHLMGTASWPTTPLRLQQRFAIDRGDHLDNVVLPALAEGATVVCDRYTPSSLAYGMAEGVDEQKIWDLNRGYPLPDLVFIVQITEEETKRRAIERGQTERLARFEKDPDLQRRVRLNYWLLRDRPICKRQDDIVMFDGMRSREKLCSKALQAILGLDRKRIHHGVGE
jgi:dTMP kinase